MTLACVAIGMMWTQPWRVRARRPERSDRSVEPGRLPGSVPPGAWWGASVVALFGVAPILGVVAGLPAAGCVRFAAA
ncbi:MAG: hypothetical protein R2695_17095 [Acidimicrobiales bacterium]